jgi:DNA repair protein RadC
MNQYIVNLNCRIDAETTAEAQTKALAQIQVREALPMITMPINVYEQLKDIRDRRKEHFIVLCLNTQNEVVRREVASVGTVNASLVHPREIFATAIAAGCASIIVAHNHPSGGLEPSAEDLQVTRRLVDAGRLIGIEVVDHIIISKNGYFSLKEHHMM